MVTAEDASEGIVGRHYKSIPQLRIYIRTPTWRHIWGQREGGYCGRGLYSEGCFALPIEE